MLWQILNHNNIYIESDVHIQMCYAVATSSGYAMSISIMYTNYNILKPKMS